MPERIVVVGTGAAGLRAAERLRELDFGGELIMVSEERYRPYHRPALTKQLLTGDVRPRDIVLPVHTELEATWRYGVSARYLEPEEHVLHLPGGEEIQYDGLIIATGVEARHLPGAPRHDPRVHVLRSVADAVGIQKAIANGRGAVAVIGGGFVGCEIASAARSMGRDAVIITREDSLLDKVPGPGLGETVTELHRSNGVQIITEVSVRHWVPRSDGIALHLSDGRVVVAGCVVLGIGGVPSTDWLRGSGLIIDDGIMCDPTCHAIGAKDIVVAGDVARWPNLLFDSVPRRVEHWLNAIEMGRAAAENLLVGRQSSRPYMPLPRFWSDQHGVKIQAAGLPALAQDTVPLAGSVRVGHRVTGYVSDGMLVGVVAWDSPRGMLKWTAELDSQLEKAMSRQPTRRYRTSASTATTAAAAQREVVELQRTPAQAEEVERRRATASAPAQPAVAKPRVPELRAPEMRIPSAPAAPPASRVAPPPVARPVAPPVPQRAAPRVVQPPPEVLAMEAHTQQLHLPELHPAAERTTELYLPDLRVPDDLRVLDLRDPEPKYNRTNGTSGYFEPVSPPVNGFSGNPDPVAPPTNRFNGFSGYFEPVDPPVPDSYEGRHGRDKDAAMTTVAQLRAVS
jgi:NADPH-dependent 2,4-dienoyl-CoA reductase/sulfur reductase-like enzyme